MSASNQSRNRRVVDIVNIENTDGNPMKSYKRIAIINDEGDKFELEISIRGSN